jgi:membrane-bound lytic murein transglycosylase MltF
MPGETCEENSIEYRLTRNFVYRLTVDNKIDTQIAKEKTLKYLAANKLDLTSFGKLW